MWYPHRFAVLGAALCAGYSLIAAAAPPALRLDAPWLRATPPGVTAAAAYARFDNPGDSARRIVGVETAVAAQAGFHSMQHEGGMMQMREMADLTVPAHGSALLAPGANHLMLMGLKRPLAVGETAAIVFVLDDGTRLSADFPVRDGAP